MTKKIDKIIIYYNDGTFEEVKTGVHDVANKQDSPPVNSIGKQDVNNYFPQYPHLQYPPGVRTAFGTNKYTIATNGDGYVDVSRNSGREFT